MSATPVVSERVSAPGADSSETHDRILDAAETLFGDKGFMSTSVRDIAAQANTSPGSINYYFGSKRGLIRAVISRVAEPLTEARLNRLAELRSQYGETNIPVREILRSFLEPLIEGSGVRRHESISRLLAQVGVASDPQIGAYWTEILGPTGEAYIEVLQRTLPHLSTGEIFLRYQFFLMASYDIRSLSGWYRSWVASSFGAEVNDITLEQRLQVFEHLFTAPETSAKPNLPSNQT